MKNKTNKKAIRIFILVITILIVSLAFYAGIKLKSTKQVSAESKSQRVVVEPNNSQTITSAQSSSTSNSQVVTTNLKIPIMMYHHIRNFDDKNDQIGFNLSITPEKLEKQLDLITSLGYTTINFNNVKSGNIPDKPIILSFDDGYQNFYDNAYPALKKRGMTAVAFIITNYKSADYLSNQEILELSDNGFEIGSHTLNHPDLSKTTKEKAIREIAESKSALEQIIKKPIISFCYPAGKYNTETVSILKENNYSYAVTTKNGLSIMSTPLELNRYRVNADTNIGVYLK